MKFYLFVTSFLVYVCTMLLGCAYDKHSNQYPEWYPPSYNSGTYWIGVGADKEKKIAIDNALIDLSAQIEITISNTYIDIEHEENGHPEYSITSTTQSKIEPTQIIGYEIEKCVLWENQYYVKLRLRKTNFTSSFRDLIDTKYSKIQYKCKQLDQYSKNNLEGVKIEIDDMLNDISKLKVLNPAFESTIYKKNSYNCKNAIDGIIKNRDKQRIKKRIIFVYQPSATNRDLKPDSNPVKHLKSKISSWFSDKLTVVDETSIRFKMNHHYSIDNMIKASKLNNIDYLCLYSVGSVLEQSDDAYFYIFVEFKMQFLNCISGKRFAEMSKSSDKYKVSMDATSSYIQTILHKAITDISDKSKYEIVQRVNNNIENDILFKNK